MRALNSKLKMFRTKEPAPKTVNQIPALVIVNTSRKTVPLSCIERDRHTLIGGRNGIASHFQEKKKEEDEKSKEKKLEKEDIREKKLKVRRK